METEAKPDRKKTCTKCGVPQHFTAFNRDSKKTDGRRNNCKSCERKRKQQWQRESHGPPLGSYRDFNSYQRAKKK